jgi:hypothetical protein
MGCASSKYTSADIETIIHRAGKMKKNKSNVDTTSDTKSNNSNEMKSAITNVNNFSSFATPDKRGTLNSFESAITGSGTTTTATKQKNTIGSSIFNLKIGREKYITETSIVDPLYVIIPYFNYCHYQRRKELFMEFYDRLKDDPRIRIVICEATESGDEFELPRDLPNLFAHIHVKTRNQIWIKESLINIAVGRLPTHWKYMAWLDCDIEFLNNTWVEDAIAEMEKYEVIQLFSVINYLGPQNESIKTDKSFGYMYRKSGREYSQKYKYGFWHPGFAWACTKHAYQIMNGLIDYAILGSGDHHMALGLISRVECSHPKDIHPNYKKLLREFEKQVRPLRLGYIDGTILHYWHGDLKLRRYKERWQILVENKYDPLQDVYCDPMGLWQLTDSGKRLEQDIRDYFAERNEDDKTIMA